MQAEALLGTVEAQLHASKPDVLADTEKELAQAFQLESRSPRAALDWARERAMVGLVKSGADVAFEDAMARDKEVGVPEEKYAFARVASFLFQGDTAGAAAVLPHWDGPAGIDPWYEMVAGATLERAGDARARDRYATAAKLDPDLVVAQVAQARATAIDGDAQRGDEARAGPAQVAARPRRARWRSWRSPGAATPTARTSRCPPEADDLARRVDGAAVGAEVRARTRSRRCGRFDKKRVGRRSGRACRGARRGRRRPAPRCGSGPSRSRWATRRSPARGPSQRCSSRRCTSPRGRSRLASRCSATGWTRRSRRPKTWSPTSPDVAVVRAASAYERVDADGVARALEALPPESAQAAVPVGARPGSRRADRAAPARPDAAR